MEVCTFERFSKDTKNHELTINLDHGLFRDLTIKRPNTSSYYYNITTRPGLLMISGDMGCYVFERLSDMFKFFRGQPDEINPCYWSEKIEAGEFKRYSPEKARDALNQEFENWKECTDFDEEQIAEEKEYLDQIDTDDEFEFVDAIRNWVPNKDGVQLDDFWEYSTNDYTFHYIWCCYAIVHAIKLYDAVKEPQQ
ncbi:hypothetical protein ASC84_12485 [Acinetobacter sp. Root1280]|uniref:hypothetical protein n=1 Tax=Acinetobacter sp. Root1280 TaxID=1736444 RepID=UPI0006F5B282|nr:hypothetical protein [Acinetobacter sp. Root1280]KQW88187.1 hypothetical protein ASC84_12485 [Acinetobacter sp. Root1280]